MKRSLPLKDARQWYSNSKFKKTLETMGQKSEKNALDIKKTNIFGLKSKTLSVVPKTKTFFACCTFEWCLDLIPEHERCCRQRHHLLRQDMANLDLVALLVSKTCWIYVRKLLARYRVPFSFGEGFVFFLLEKKRLVQISGTRFGRTLGSCATNFGGTVASWSPSWTVRHSF